MRLQFRLLLPLTLLLLTSFLFHSSAFSWKCLGCEAGVEVVRFLYEQNATTAEILKAADYVCRHFADQDSFVCRGITSQFQDEFLYVLGRLVFWPSQLCGLLLRDCGSPIDPFDSNWTVPLPPKSPPRPITPPQSTSPPPTLRILQLSDIHFDPAYLEGSEAECDEPVCCLLKVDEPRRRAGYWGTAANCDIPLRLLENLLEHINRSHKLDLAFLSGDYVDHRDWAYSRRGHESAIGNISALLQRYLPQLPVFWTLGNHEGVPVNAFAPHFVPVKYRPEWIYRKMLEEGRRTAHGKLPPSVDASALYRGSYSVDLETGLRLISLNNGYCDKTNMFIFINQTDPDGSLTWLVDQLWEAEKAGKSIYILAHIPPGDAECLESWSRNYYRIVVRFAESIRAQFFGHTHFDSFSLFFADMDNPKSPPTSMLYTAPSVTTFQNLNPAYRIYVVDPSNWEVLDHETYFLNLSSLVDGQPPKWEFLYSARTEYGLKDLSAGEWANLVGRIEKDPEIARKFNRNYVREDNAGCDAKCLKQRICSIRAAHHNEKALCGKKGKKPSRKGAKEGLEGRRRAGHVERRHFKKLVKRALWMKLAKWTRGRHC